MMTETARRVAELVEAIPPGLVMTYGEVARAVGTSALTVGRILNKHGHALPWWRVVDATGRPYKGAIERAKTHLAEEGTPMAASGSDLRVDLKRASWMTDGGRRR